MTYLLVMLSTYNTNKYYQYVNFSDISMYKPENNVKYHIKPSLSLQLTGDDSFHPIDGRCNRDVVSRSFAAGFRHTAFFLFHDTLLRGAAARPDHPHGGATASYPTHRQAAGSPQSGDPSRGRCGARSRGCAPCAPPYPPGSSPRCPAT